MKPLQLSALSLLLVAHAALAQESAQNSNLWPVHRDTQAGFRISYPSGWRIVPTKGLNVRFSVSPPVGSGNCDVVAKPNADIKSVAQAALNSEIESLPIDGESWAEYIGLPPSKVRLIEARRARVHDVPAIIGVVETALENLEGKFMRKQVVAMTFTPGVTWSLNCGASAFNTDDAKIRFTELQPTFNKVLGSFGFLR